MWYYSRTPINTQKSIYILQLPTLYFSTVKKFTCTIVEVHCTVIESNRLYTFDFFLSLLQVSLGSLLEEDGDDVEHRFVDCC